MIQLAVNSNIAKIQHTLSCPACGCGLDANAERFVCTNDGCLKSFPVVDGIPILIDDNKSIFDTDKFVSGLDTTWKSKKSSLRKLVRGLTPEISHNIKGEENFKIIASLLPAGANVLVVGGGVRGPGIDVLYNLSAINIVASDVFIGPHVDVVLDAHDIPVQDDFFDAVVVQSVLEHVLDPTRCVTEIYRVLKPDAIVYAETPFIQQVHMKEYDFCRFTDLGHRRLFRNFTEITRGSTGGPGMALAWSYRAFVRSFTDRPALRSILTIFSHWTSFFLKYFDYWLIDRSAASEGSSEYYFLGKKSTEVLSDTDLINSYKGVRW